MCFAEGEMKLILVRHGIAGVRDILKWPNDGDRPLTQKGRRRFEVAAQGLAQLEPEVDLVLASLKVRAWDTAVILHEEAGWPAPQALDELRESAPEAVLAALEPYRSLDSVALVGHEPFLTRLASHLLASQGGIAIDLKKGGALCLELPEEGSESTARLLWLLQPKALRGLA
jgi:phosphohistidine phosphatase